MGKLDNRVVLVTGGARGLGLAMARALASEGAQIALVDIDGEGLQKAAGEIERIAGREAVVPIGAEVCDPDSASTAVHYTVDNFGRIDMLLNNAAVGPQEVAGDFYGDAPRFWELNPYVFLRMMEVNAAGPQLMSAIAAPYMIEQGQGRIVNITTALDAMYASGMGGYGPSKAALEAHTAIMANDLKGTGVTANVLIPGGPANTRMIPETTGIPREALIQPEAMQAPAVWLASDESSDFNGQRLIAALWDESLPLPQRLERAAAPCAWPQLGKQAILPGGIAR